VFPIAAHSSVAAFGSQKRTLRMLPMLLHWLLHSTDVYPELPCSVPQQTWPLGQSVLSSQAIVVPAGHAIKPVGSHWYFGGP